MKYIYVIIIKIIIMHYREPTAHKKANVFGNYILFPALMSESMRKP